MHSRAFMILRIVGLFFALAWTLPTLPATAGAGIEWMTFETAQQKGNSDNKKYFMYFYSDNCGYCRMLEEKTFSKNEVSSYVNSNFVPIRINTDREAKLAARYSVQGVPDLRFVKPGGEAIARWPGYAEADHLLALLKFVGSDSYTKMSFSQFVKTLGP